MFMRASSFPRLLLLRRPARCNPSLGVDALAQAVTELESSSERETAIIAEISASLRLVGGPVTRSTSRGLDTGLARTISENRFEVAQRGYVIIK